MRSLANGLLAVDNGELQLIFHRQGIDVCGSRCRGLALHPGEVRHVDLQRIARGLVAEDQLARKFDLFLRNLVQGINLRVIHDGHIEPMIDRFMHENGIQHAPRIGVEAERNIAHTQNGFDVRQLLLDPLDGLERLHACGTVFLLARRNGQGQSVENEIGGIQSVFLGR